MADIWGLKLTNTATTNDAIAVDDSGNLSIGGTFTMGGILQINDNVALQFEGVADDTDGMTLACDSSGDATVAVTAGSLTINTSDNVITATGEALSLASVTTSAATALTLGVSGAVITDAAASVTLYGGNTNADSLILQGASTQATQKITIVGGTGTTVTGTLASTGALTAASIVCTAGITVGGGYGAAGASIDTDGVGTFNGALTTDGILTSAGVVTSAIVQINDNVALNFEGIADDVDGLQITCDNAGDSLINSTAGNLTLTTSDGAIETASTITSSNANSLATTGATLGVSIGATVTGMSIAACSAVGINFSGINRKGITMGTTGGSGSTTALGTLANSWYGIEMSVSANCAGNEAHAIRAEIETTAGTAGNIMCARFDAVATESVNTLNGINATAQMNDDLTIGGRVAAGYISLYGAAGKTLTRTANSIYGLFVQHLLYSDPGDATNPAGAGGVADFYNAAVGISMPSGTYCDYGIVVKGETNGTVAAILLGPHGTTTWENGIRFSNGSPGDAGSTVSGGITNAIYFDSQCPVVDLVKWEATGYATGCVDTSDSISTQTGASTGAIKVDIAGSKYYIPIFAEGSQGAGP